MGFRQLPDVALIPNDHAPLSALLASEGFIAAEEESEELLAYAAGDDGLLNAAVPTPAHGREPLAWITGSTSHSAASRSASTQASTCPAGSASRSRGEPSSDSAMSEPPSTCARDPARSPRCSGHDVRGPAWWRPMLIHAPSRAPRHNGVDVYRGDLLRAAAGGPRGPCRRRLWASVPYVPDAPSLPLAPAATPSPFETRALFLRRRPRRDRHPRQVDARPRDMRRPPLP